MADRELPRVSPGRATLALSPSYENAVRLLQATAQAGDAQARAAVNSVVTDSEGALVVQTLDRPWCDGALYTLNPSPSLYADDERLAQGEHVSAGEWRAFDRGAQRAGWRGYAGGFAVAHEAGRGGSGAICYQRPYLFLMNTVYDEFRPEWVKLCFKRSIAWGHFPSFFSHNAADDPYWQRPNLYNRDRPLFQKYIPVCATLSRAGWEPVTHARATPDHVCVERFGPDEDGAVYLTLFNDSDAPCEADLQIEPAAMPAGHAEEVLADGPQPLQRAALGLWTVPLKAHDLAVLRFTQRP